MNLSNIKKDIIKELGVIHLFRFRGMRNQTQEFTGYIKKCYPAVFIIETTEGVLKSFSYNDYIIDNIKIIS